MSLITLALLCYIFMCGFVHRWFPSDSETCLYVSDDFRDIWDIPCFYRKPKFNSELKLKGYIIFHIYNWVRVNFSKTELNSEFRVQNWTEGFVCHDCNTKRGGMWWHVCGNFSFLPRWPCHTHAQFDSLPALLARGHTRLCLFFFFFILIAFYIVCLFVCMLKYIYIYIYI